MPELKLNPRQAHALGRLVEREDAPIRLERHSEALIAVDFDYRGRTRRYFIDADGDVSTPADGQPRLPRGRGAKGRSQRHRARTSP